MGDFKIAICDDEWIIVEQLNGMVSECIEKKGIEYSINTFLSGMDIIQSEIIFDLIFLDIEMPEIDGIEIGKRIRKNNYKCKIIMATSRVERFKEAFQLDAFRFITKPFDKSEIKEAIDAVLATKLGMEEIELYLNRNAYKVQQRSIKYITTYDSISEFIIKDKILRRDISLDSLENILDERLFFRIHRKMIVNLGFVTHYNQGIISIGEKEIKVAIRKRKAFEKAYIEFDLNYR